MPDHSAGMPPELRLMICQYMPRQTLKDVCLVSRLWRCAAAVLLWHEFVSNLQSNLTKDWDALMASMPGGFIDSVRVMNITRNSGSLLIDNIRLFELLSLLQHGILRKFETTEPISARTLGLLIKGQPQLRGLTARICNNDASDRPPDRRYTKGNLKSLESLRIMVNRDQREYDAWFAHTPSLRTLLVSGPLGSPRGRFTPWQSQVQLMRFENLKLVNLNLEPRSGRLDAWTDLSRLQNLIIRSCDGLATFMVDLSKAYSNLKVFPRSFSLLVDVSEGCFDPLMDILRSMHGLEYLYISTATAEKLHRSSLKNHATSLRYFLLDTTRPYSPEHGVFKSSACRHDSAYLLQLAKLCPQIEELGIGLPRIRALNRVHNGSFSWSSEGKRSKNETLLTSSLDVLATFRNLRILRLTSTPIANKRHGPFRPQYHKLAEQILGYLVSKGSPIQVLAFAPLVVESSEELDDNGHAWPYYYYLKGFIKTFLPGRCQTERVVAVPVKKDDIKTYVQKLWILTDGEMPYY